MLVKQGQAVDDTSYDTKKKETSGKNIQDQGGGDQRRVGGGG